MYGMLVVTVVGGSSGGINYLIWEVHFHHLLAMYFIRDQVAFSFPTSCNLAGFLMITGSRAKTVTPPNTCLNVHMWSVSIIRYR